METAFLPPPTEATTPCRTPPKNRSFSDPPNAPTALQPSPNLRESVRRQSKDDNAVPTTPRASTSISGLRRPQGLVRGLSLQMPQNNDSIQFPPPSSPYSARAGPLSPQLDQHNDFMPAQNQQQHSPATSLPRHSRGLDFSRACTNLHHSTVAEQTSPDMSPILTHKGVAIPGRKMSVSSMALDSPALGYGNGWGSLNPEKSTVSSSVGSVNMMISDSESSDSDEDASMAGDDGEDGIFTTPQVHKLQNPSAPTPFNPRDAWGRGDSAYSPAAASLMKTIRRTRLQKGNRKSRKSSSSASNSGYSSMASPRTTSPPPLRSIETATGSGGYFPWSRGAQSRRQSLALGTDGLHLSSGNDSGDEAPAHPPSTPGVVRRVVTRRGNLLPKTKGFARIRAALAEEAQPVDTEVRREAETIRQVRERDSGVPEYSLEPDRERPGTATGQSSPNLLPAVPESAQEDFGKDLDIDSTPNPFKSLGSNNGLGMKFNSYHRSLSGGGSDFWARFDNRLEMRTPPPPAFPRHSSSVISDINMDSPSATTETGSDRPFAYPGRRLRAASSASDMTDNLNPANPNNNPPPNTNGSNAVNDDMHLKKFKRRREDDFDIATIKRRAVSPGMGSTQNSPVLAQSPTQKDLRDGVGSWGQPPEKKGGGNGGGAASGKDGAPLSAGESDKEKGGGSAGLTSWPPLHQMRSGSQGSNASATATTNGGAANANGNGNGNGGGGGIAQNVVNPGKKLGLQGMVDTNDGLMKMSIE